MKQKKSINKKSRKGQESKSLISRKSGQGSKSLLSRKSGQEEMVGFGLIIVLVAIIFIVFIAVYLKKPVKVTEDYEARSFIQATLQYTTMCEDTKGNVTVQDLITKCKENDLCSYRNMDPCQILNNTIKGIIRESWESSPNGFVKGYSFEINISEDRGESEENLVKIESGVVTNNYRGSIQDYGKSGDRIIILFKVYN